MFGESQKCANISPRYGFIFFSANTSNHRPVKFLFRTKMKGTIRGASSTNHIWSDTEALSFLACVKYKEKLVSLILGYHAYLNYSIEIKRRPSFRNIYIYCYNFPIFLLPLLFFRNIDIVVTSIVITFFIVAILNI